MTGLSILVDVNSGNAPYLGQAFPEPVAWLGEERTRMNAPKCTQTQSDTEIERDGILDDNDRNPMTGARHRVNAG